MDTNSPELLHPFCPDKGLAPIIVYDLTAALQRLVAREYSLLSVCVFNPSLVHYKGTLFYWFARLWIAPKDAPPGCPGPTSTDYGAWANAWFNWDKPFLHGQMSLVIQHDLLTGEPLRIVHHYMHSNTTLRVWDGWHEVVSVSNYREDCRAFKDATGVIRLLHGSAATHSNSTGRPEGTGIHAVEMHVTRVDISETKHGIYSITMQEHLALPYTRLPTVPQNASEKNFVPWSGTSLMSYPHYPWGFAQHSVFNWGDYDKPAYAHAFNSTVEVPFFQGLRRFALAQGMELRSHNSGGTPAVPYQGGWLAAGHQVEAASCFHYFHGKLGRNDTTRSTTVVQCVPSNLQSLLCKPEDLYKFGPREFVVGNHHRQDYFMFLYRFEGHPPYRLTHMSDAFKLLSREGAMQHQGVFFPAGMERFGDGVLLSYGEDDIRAKVAWITQEQIDAMMYPIDGPAEYVMESAPYRLRYCTVKAKRQVLML